MQNWKHYNIFLSDEIEKNGTGSYTTVCPKCKESHHSTLMVNLENQSWYCVQCGFAGNLHDGIYTVPTKQRTPWPYNQRIKNYNLVASSNKALIKSFAKLHISEGTIQHFYLSTSKEYFPSLGQEQPAIVFPYTQGTTIANLIYMLKDARASEFGGVQSCFNFNGIEEDNTFIVFDEIEVLTFYEAGIPNAICGFGGQEFKKDHKQEVSVEKLINNKLDFLHHLEDKIAKIKKFTIAMPSTDLGEQMKQEILRRIGKERCWIISPPEPNYTWNQFFSDYGPERFKLLLNNAKAIPVRGIIEVDEVEEDLDNLYYNGMQKGATTGYPSLDELYTVVPGQWTVVTGIPNHGKSNFLDAILVNLAKFHDWRFGIFSPENQPVARYYASVLEKYYGKSFEKDKNNRITEDQKEEGKIWIKKHFSVILPHEDDSATIDSILSLAKVLVYRKGIKGLVIDPWNEIDHARPPGQTETEYISMVLTKIRQFARNYRVHVWVVAHPAKLQKDKTTGKYPVPTPYDISGSAHYRNKADNAFAVYRNVGGVDQDISDIHIQKIRFKEVGRVGIASLRYDIINGKFIDDIDQEKRQLALTQPEAVPTPQLIKTFY